MNFGQFYCQHDVFRLQNYTNMVVDERGIQTFEFVVVVLLLLLLSLMFCPHECTFLIIFWHLVCPNILKR